MKPVVVLVGPPGAGKTTVGRKLALALGTSFRDTDADIEAREEKPVADIFFEDGEEYFRAVERQIVGTALQQHDGVLSLGGGAVLDQRTRALLRAQRVVFLAAGLGATAKRVGLAASRPVLALNPRASLELLLRERIPLYREVCTLELATDDRTPDEVVAELQVLLAP